MNNIKDIDLKEIAMLRLVNSGLIEKKFAPGEVVSRLCGVQAQNIEAAFVSILLRTQRLSYGDLTDALWNQRSWIRIWSLRSTLHIHSIDDWALIASSLAQENTWYAHNLKKCGESLECYLQLALGAVGAKEFFCKSNLVDAGIPQGHIGPWGGLLIELSRRGEICHGRSRDGARGFWVRRKTFPRLQWFPTETHDAYIEMAKRYFLSYGPATIKDFAHWMGISITAAKRIVNDTFDRLRPCGTFNGVLLYTTVTDDVSDSTKILAAERSQKFFLLGRFDPLLLGYSDKSWITDPLKFNRIWRTAGHVGGVILKHFRAAGTWSYRINRDKLSFFIEPFDARTSFKKVSCEFEKIADSLNKKIFSIEIAR